MSTGMAWHWHGPVVRHHDSRTWQESNVQNLLFPWELGVADSAYSAYPYMITPLRNRAELNDDDMLWNMCVSSVRITTCERYFGRMKDFAVLNQPFRHRLELHRPCLVAISNMLNANMDQEPLVQTINPLLT